MTTEESLGADSVRIGDIYTIPNVDGLDLYFRRATGTIDETGPDFPSCGSESSMCNDREGLAERRGGLQRIVSDLSTILGTGSVTDRKGFSQDWPVQCRPS